MNTKTKEEKQRIFNYYLENKDIKTGSEMAEELGLLTGTFSSILRSKWFNRLLKQKELEEQQEHKDAEFTPEEYDLLEKLLKKVLAKKPETNL